MLESVRKDVKNLQQETAEVVMRSAEQAEEVRALLEALGPRPGEGEPPEERSVADRREQLQSKIVRSPIP